MRIGRLKRHNRCEQLSSSCSFSQSFSSGFSGTGKTLMFSAGEAPSIMQSGAYYGGPVGRHFGRTPDPGAPGVAVRARD